MGNFAASIFILFYRYRADTEKMNSIAIKNLRCLADTDEIRLLPLSVSVGKNSSGKSTLLRVFPLFKQTIETKRSEPILWYGNYTDFGDFENSLFNKQDRSISFSFSFSLKTHIYSNDFFSSNLQDVEIKVKITTNEEQIKAVSFLFDNNNISVVFGNERIKKINMFRFNDVIFNYDNDNNILYDYYTADNEIIPELNYNRSSRRQYEDSDLDFQIFLLYQMKKYNEFINDFVEKRSRTILKKPIIDLLSSNYVTYYLNSNGFKSLLKDYLKNKTNNKITKTNNVNNQVMDIYDQIVNLFPLDDKETKALFYYAQLPILIKECNDYLTQYFGSISYMAPLRATAERYYRKQGLNIQDVDPRGENVPMILKSMNGTELERFTEWLSSNFDFTIKTQDNVGHISIIIQNGEHEFNIADTGFGYSQILPMILLIWKNSNEYFKTIRNSREERVIKQIVIEQPELHLHPKMQAQLINIIVRTINNENNIHFLIETHSENIINCLGRAIENKKIANDKVNVLLFDQDTSGLTSIRDISYSQNGYLKKWPIDFFMENEI